MHTPRGTQKHEACPRVHMCTRASAQGRKAMPGYLACWGRQMQTHAQHMYMCTRMDRDAAKHGTLGRHAYDTHWTARLRAANSNTCIRSCSSAENVLHSVQDILCNTLCAGSLCKCVCATVCVCGCVCTYITHSSSPCSDIPCPLSSITNVSSSVAPLASRSTRTRAWPPRTSLTALIALSAHDKHM